MTITITAFERSPDGGRGLARDTRVRWALEEAGQPYEVRLVSFRAMKGPAHLALHPFGQIPTYKEGDLALFETGAIVFHIAQRHAGLLPDDANARARAITWMFAAVNTVEPPILELETARLLEGDKPWHDERLPLVEDRVRNRLKQLSAHLGDADWLDGAFSAGDLMMVSVLFRLKSSGILDEYPNLAAYLARGETRPAYKRAFAAQLAVNTGKRRPADEVRPRLEVVIRVFRSKISGRLRHHQYQLSDPAISRAWCWNRSSSNAAMICRVRTGLGDVELHPNRPKISSGLSCLCLRFHVLRVHRRGLPRARPGMHMHRFRRERLTAFRTDHHGIKHVSAVLVLVQHRPSPRIHHVDVAPVHDRHDDRIEVEALLGQDVFVALGRFLIGDPAQHAEAHQFLQAIRQYMAGDPERGLECLEPSLAQKAFADQEGPAITDHGNRSGHRAGLFLKRTPLHQFLQSLRGVTP